MTYRSRKNITSIYLNIQIFRVQQLWVCAAFWPRPWLFTSSTGDSYVGMSDMHWGGVSNAAFYLFSILTCDFFSKKAHFPWADLLYTSTFTLSYQMQKRLSQWFCSSLSSWISPFLVVVKYLASWPLIVARPELIQNHSPQGDPPQQAREGRLWRRC